MEDLLEQIIKEATGNKFLHLRNAAQTAHGKVLCAVLYIQYRINLMLVLL